MIIHTTISWKLIPRLAPGSSPPIGGGTNIPPSSSQSQCALNHSAGRAALSLAERAAARRTLRLAAAVRVWLGGPARRARECRISVVLCLIKIRVSPHFHPVIYIYNYNENHFSARWTGPGCLAAAGDGYLVNLICKYIPSLCVFQPGRDGEIAELLV